MVLHGTYNMPFILDLPVATIQVAPATNPQDSNNRQLKLDNSTIHVQRKVALKIDMVRG